MKAITEFSLEIPTVPREDWPLKLRLLRRGRPTSLALPGRELLHQFGDEAGFLFITDYDCPFEESIEFILCDAELVCRGRCTAGAPYCSVWLSHVEWIDHRHLRVELDRDGTWLLTIRSWGIPYLFPRLRLKRCKNVDTNNIIAQQG